MKKMILAILLVFHMTLPLRAGLTTSQEWFFESDSKIIQKKDYKTGYTTWGFSPTVNDNSQGTAMASVRAKSYWGRDDWGLLSTVDWIKFDIPNYDQDNPTKTIDLWLVYGPMTALGDVTDVRWLTQDGSALASWEETDRETTSLGCGWYETKISLLLLPNPGKERIEIDFNGCMNMLKYARVDTSCNPVPAPGAVLLSGLGVGMVGWLRRQKSF